MAPRTKAAQSCLSNLKSDLSLKRGPFPRLDDNPHVRNSLPTHWVNISKKVTVKDCSESDLESDNNDLFDFDGIGHGEEDDSDLSDSDTESDEEGDFDKICEDAVFLLFSETLQQAQRDAAEGNRKRWKEKKQCFYCFC